MSDLHWTRWRRYPDGPLQRWHLATGSGDSMRTICGTTPGQYAVEGGTHGVDEMPKRPICGKCEMRHAEIIKQAKGWTV